MTKVEKSAITRIYQGEIISNVECIEHAAETEGVIEITKIVFPNVVVLTQDCDLEQYFSSIDQENPSADNDKHLISVIVAPIYNFEHFVTGEHLSELGMKMQSFSRGKTPIKKIQQNKDPRYHTLFFDEDIPIANSVIDFKHYFSISINDLKRAKLANESYLIRELYREDISHRFAHFLSRIGLPGEN